MSAQPLKGYRILDLSRILAGPWCSQQLADLGAEVIKIERPGEGDDTRRWGPPWLPESKEAAYYLAANRGKQSVTIDMAQAQGQALIHELVKHCDVVLENFKVGGLKKYHLDYESLKAIKNDIIYCSITGFGQDGPYAHRAGYDFMIQGLGGLMSLTGQPDSELGGGPVKVGVAITDIFTGMYAANAIMAALLQKSRTGEGAYIDLALLDVQVGVLANQALNYLTSNQVPQRLGNAHPNIVPYQAFPTSDGFIILAVGNDAQFKRFCEVAKCDNWIDDPRFKTNALRVENRQILVELIKREMVKQSTDTWLAELEVVGVPCGPINTLDRVFADPQVQHRHLKITLPHPVDGQVDLVSNPIRFNHEALNATLPPPLLGQHTSHVLQGVLGLSDIELAELKEAKIIA